MMHEVYYIAGSWEAVFILNYITGARATVVTLHYNTGPLEAVFIQPEEKGIFILSYTFPQVSLLPNS